jgi:hypothetical protein
VSTTRKAARVVTIGKSEIRPIRTRKTRSSSVGHYHSVASPDEKVAFVPGTPSKSLRFSELDQLKQSPGGKANGRGDQK